MKKRVLALMLCLSMTFSLVMPGMAVELDEEPAPPVTTEEPAAEPTPEVSEEPSATPTEEPEESVDPTDPTEEPVESTEPTDPSEEPEESADPADPTEEPEESPEPTEPTEEPAASPEPTVEPTPVPSQEPFPSWEDLLAQTYGWELDEEVLVYWRDLLDRVYSMDAEELYATLRGMADEESRDLLKSMLGQDLRDQLDAYLTELGWTHPRVVESYAGEETTGVSVEIDAPVGAFPEGTTAAIQPVELPAALDGAALSGSSVAYDITFYDADGNEIQPAEGYTVTLSFRVGRDSGLLDAKQLQVYHLEEDADGQLTAQPVGAPVDVTASGDAQEITVEAESFSIYVVNNGTPTGAALSNVTKTLTVDVNIGDQLSFYSDKATTTKTIKGQETPKADWSSSNEKVATISNKNGQYVDLTVRGAGTTTITYTYYTKETFFISWFEPHTESFTLTIKEAPAVIDYPELYIVNQIPENGCFVPVLNEEKVSIPEGATIEYTWYKNVSLTGEDNLANYSEVTGDGIDPVYTVDTNGVNVAVDDGGKCWYYVTATVTPVEGDPQTYTSEPMWAAYSNKLENGSFEVPTVPQSGSGSYNTQLNQDDPRWITTAENVENNTAVWWRTTGPKNGQDIEIVWTGWGEPGWKNNWNTGLNDQFHMSNTDSANDHAPDGSQFAEINAEAYGALYQDVLTAPGSDLYWSLMHRGRQGTDDMRVVIMPASMAQNYTNETQLRQLIADYDAGKLDSSIVYVSPLISHDDSAWVNVAGKNPYTVQDGQYLTRFFFVSTKGSSATVGNLVDAVSFSDEMPYTIEYYVDGVKQTADTETGMGKPFTLVSANKTGNYTAYALEKIMRGEELYGDTSMRLSTEKSNVLKIYYVTSGISVTKTVELPDDLTDDQIAELLAGYQVSFNLYEGTDTTGDPAATATVTVGDSGSGTALFMANGERFDPKANTLYTIVESTAPAYLYDSNTDTYYDLDASESTGTEQTVTTAPNSASVSFTNVYTERPKKGDLVIEKTVDEKPVQSFIFTVEGTDYELTVVLTPDDFTQDDGSWTVSVTIKDLPADTYTVTEDTGWSWKYDIDGDATKSAVIDGGVKTVSFTNKRNDENYLSGSTEAENVFAKTGGTGGTNTEDADIIKKSTLLSDPDDKPEDDENEEGGR